MARTRVQVPIDRINALRAKGYSKASITKMLVAEYKVNQTTVYRWLSNMPSADRPSPMARAEAAAALAVPELPATGADDASGATPSAYVAPVFEGLTLEQNEDLAELLKTRASIVEAVRKWEESLAFNPTAVLQHQRLSKSLADITARILELRPRPEVERDRLEELGSAARDALVARARAAALPDEISALQLRVRTQAAVIERLTCGPK